MSTRSNIKLIDETGAILLYKHHDGYPDSEHGIIEFLKPYITNSMKSADWMAKCLIKDTECEVTTCLHGDIEYYYEVDVSNNSIAVFKYDMFAETKELIDTLFDVAPEKVLQ